MVIQSNPKTTDMTTLEKILTEQTQSLKEQYIEKTIEWAKTTFNRYQEMIKWDEVKWCRHLGLDPEKKMTTDFKTGKRIEKLGFPKGFWNSKESKTYDTTRRKIDQALRIGVDKFIAKEEEYAINHYENSIIKLANRIEKKKLDHNNLQVNTSHIGPNIDTTISDGNKTVRAWTIIASGEIQRPHYRYLIK